MNTTKTKSNGHDNYPDSLFTKSVSQHRVIEYREKHRGRSPLLDQVAVYDEHKLGLTAGELAKIYSVHPNTIYNTLSREHLARHGERMPKPERNAQIIEERKAGLTFAELAKKHNLSRNWIWKIVHEHSPIEESPAPVVEEITACEAIEGMAKRRAEERAKAGEADRLAAAEQMIEKLVKTLNQHADDGNADQKRIEKLEEHIAELETENRLLWKRLEGINQELNEIDAVPPARIVEEKARRWWHFGRN